MGYSAQVQQGNNQLSGGGKSGQVGGSPGQTNNINDFLAQFRQPESPTGMPEQGIPNSPTMPNRTLGSQIGLGVSSVLQGANGLITNSATSGQPQMGMPNQYSNTVGMGDNKQQQSPNAGGGKGKV